jgi:phosphate transport system permease protein
MAALPLQIYTYALSAFDEWHRLAWAGSLMLVVMIVGATAIVRFVFLRRMLEGAR